MYGTYTGTFVVQKRGTNHYHIDNNEFLYERLFGKRKTLGKYKITIEITKEVTEDKLVCHNYAFFWTYGTFSFYICSSGLLKAFPDLDLTSLTYEAEYEDVYFKILKLEKME